MADSPKPLPKRIIICCDGSWQSAVSGERNTASNVTRLARCLKRAGVDKHDKTWQQIVWYDSGVATTSSFIGNLAEGFTGSGMEGNIIEAYNFVVLNWSPGDQVFCFGFSRGAYTARSVAGLISDIGICEPSRLHEFPEIWELYKANYKGERFHGSDAWFDYVDGVPGDDKDQPEDLGDDNVNFVWAKPPRGDWAVTPESREIEVVGVYETVGGLGIPELHGVKLTWGPDKHGFHNVKLNPNVKHAFQALALDEHRASFSPTLWHLPELKDDIKPGDLEAKRKRVDEAEKAWNPKFYDKTVPLKERQELKKLYNKARRELYQLEEERKERSDLLQVWFPGMHINIGGGSTRTLENKGDLEETSNITFAWMLDQISTHLAIDERVIRRESRARQDHINELNKEEQKYRERVAKEDAEAAKLSFVQWAGRALVSTATSAASVAMHPLTKTKAPNKQRRDFGWGTGTIIDSFGLLSNLNGSKVRTPGGYTTAASPGDTNEQIHPCVGYRHDAFKDEKKELQYHPAGLEEGKYQRRQKKQVGGGWEYVLGDAVVPEYRMRPNVEGASPTFERFNLSLAWEKTKTYVTALDDDNGMVSVDL
ncbi:hypothetical protein B0J13DRAFT_477188 [Dactylonectria estremocensis]|uniref:T6SS Phospholipase effector Tle1-like catalytic domain-containing protein n=1 Tax=Dactylonectria estremocensis TaxID=1079267 RepID=A0A9P9EN75_9HYPO|nr:hypothetical protein B0J13DRAFT_477188 [Dactylonectria estremocensis]